MEEVMEEVMEEATRRRKPTLTEELNADRGTQHQQTTPVKPTEKSNRGNQPTEGQSDRRQ